MTFFSVLWGQNLEDRAAHPHEEFKRVPPGSCISSDMKALLSSKLAVAYATDETKLSLEQGYQGCFADVTTRHPESEQPTGSQIIRICMGIYRK